MRLKKTVYAGFKSPLNSSAYSLYRFEPPIRAIGNSQNGRHIVLADNTATLYLYDVRTGEYEMRLSGNDSSINVLNISPNGKWVVAGGLDSAIRVWQPELALHVRRNVDFKNLKEFQEIDKPVTVLRGHDAEVRCIAFGSLEHIMASGGLDGAVVVWDLRDGRPIHRFDIGSVVNALGFAPDGLTLYAGTDTRAVSVWDMSTLRKVSEYRDPLTPVYSLAISSDGAFGVSGGYGEVRVWETSNLRTVQTFSTSPQIITSVGFGVDSPFVVWSTQVDPLVRGAWHSGNGKTDVIVGHHGAISRLWFSSDGTRLISTGSDDSTIEWDLQTKSGKYLEVAPLERAAKLDPSALLKTGGVPITQPSPGMFSQRLVALAASSGTRRYAVAWEKEVQVFRCNTVCSLVDRIAVMPDASAIALSSSGTLVAIGSQAGIVILMDVK